MKLIATAIAAFGLMAAPLAAQDASSQVPEVQTAGVAQQAQIGQAPLLGIPPLVLGVVGAAVIIGGAVALSNTGDDNNSTPNTR
ncbi:hypothetical protein [uncultured Albimonas sp.]|uniref:hypothetical protein n=1 Tax=uncultured Albimonas sp. TaxID=1331701 RepID=UPI0030EC0F24|tara:strand:+ start:14405 stop:14656 length:252 start_codon:yes stop_codon:yes gene_type:complete